ncbi:MAG: acyltransferase domain-containing protein, partial [Candidatus Binataceae bacterium]
MTAPNPHIDWKSMPLKVTASVIPWDPIDGRRIGGVSSFGFSGTNVHVIVEESSQETQSLLHPVSLQTELMANVFAISARDAAALSVHATQCAVAVAGYNERDLAHVCHTANFGRSHFAERATVMGRTIREFSDRLGALARGEEVLGVRRARLARRDPPRIAFVFTGQGSQYSGMARRLYDVCPAFRDSFDRCASLLKPHLSRPLHDVVFADGNIQSDINNTAYAQPALFAVEYALTEVWRSFGVVPNLVAGHSVGEIVAATVAGVFSLEDGLRLIARRGALMASLPEGGSMAVIASSEEDVALAIAQQAGDLAIAAVNAPMQTVISGVDSAVDFACASFAGKGVRCQRLSVSHAFHSPLMDPVLDPFEHEMRAITLAAPRLPLISNLTGQLAEAREITQARYWRRHLREAVRFGDCVSVMTGQKVDCIVEIGPQPTLLSLFGAGLPEGPALIGSLRKGRDDWEQVLEGASALFLAGAEIDWRAAARGEKREIVDLPTYPFQRQRQWFEAKPKPPQIVVSEAGDHPMLGRRLPSPLPQIQFESRLAALAPAFIKDHQIRGTVVMRGAVLFEMAIAAAVAVFGPGPHFVEDTVFLEAMIFTDGDRIVQTIVDPILNGTSRFQIQSKPERTDEWTLHFEGRLRSGASDVSSAQVEPFAEVAARCVEIVPVGDFYERMQQQGIAMGPSFHVVREMKRAPGEACGFIALTGEVAPDRRYGIHPILLDGCLQTVMAAVFPDVDRDALYLPIGLRRLRAFSPLASVGRTHAVVEPGTRPGSHVLKANVTLYGPDDDLIATFEGLEFQRIQKDALLQLARGRTDEWIYERVWEPAPLVAAVRRHPSTWVVLGDQGGIAAMLVDALEARGDRCLLQPVRMPTNAVDGFAGDATIDHVPYRKWRDEFGDISGIVDLSWLDCSSDATGRSLHLALQNSVSRSLSLIKAIIAESEGRPPRLWVVTRGAQPAGEVRSPLAPLASAAWGLTWSAALEHPELRAVCVDLDQASDPNEIAKLVSEFDQEGSDDKIAIRGGQRLAARLKRRERDRVAKPSIPQVPYRLESRGRGTLDALIVTSAERRVPGDGEVEIRVEATGLNFRDVLNVLGLYPGDAGPLGGECAGEVVRVGQGVQDLREGDRVVAMAAGCFASHAIARRELVQPSP